MTAHDHYCVEWDHRWVCRVDPCLLHLVVPCQDHAKKSLANPTLDKPQHSDILSPVADDTNKERR